ncbi:hypothetical protein ACHAWO_008459 [Cyclotella atomus]|uniref:SAYSvFN domain-containing protein n=1 Tax=Cyclotella atomus TaxID=382360 RepID=A0ABD3QHH4_9STRA
MPPHRPDFLPPNRIRRRQLDPTRQLTSRELWNQVRFHSTATSSNDATEPSHSLEYYTSLLHAILYEIQPFRIKPFLRRARTFLLEEDGFKQSCLYCIERVRSIALLFLYCTKYVYESAKMINLKSIKSCIESKMFRYSIMICSGLYVYGRFLVDMHEWLNAGPMVFIMTLLVLIYTIGLGDNTGASSGVPSAYSVFNRGVQRLIGQEDAETLANQFVRAAAGRGLDVGDAGRNDRGVGRIWIGDDEQDQVDDQDAINERRRRRRLERLQQRNGDEGVQPVDDHVEGNEDEADLEPEDTPQNDTTAARKSGKKARRRDLEVRREMQRQRQEAAAMGFGGNDIIEGVGNLNALD